MRKLLVIVPAVIVLAATAAAVPWFLHQRLLDGREDRIAALQARLGDLRATERPSPRQACLIAEHHLLSRPIGRALRVVCDAPRLEGTGPGVARLSGLVYETDMFGGAFGESLCLARTADGWAVVGDAFRLNDCRFTAPADARVDEAAAVVAGAVAGKSRAAAERAIALIRQALAGADTTPVPESCAGLEAVTPRQLGLVDTDVLAAAPSEDEWLWWQDLTTGAIAACLDVGILPDRSRYCRLDEPWRYVLAFDRSVKSPPVQSGTDGFYGGVFQSTLRLIDMQAGQVICARPVTAQMDEEVLTTATRLLRDIYRDEVREAVCREVQALGRGMLELSYDWRCD